MRNAAIFTIVFFVSALSSYAETTSDLEREQAGKLVREAIDYWRDTSSYTVAELLVHRPDWERSMKFRAWTRGRNETLVRFVAPPKDYGNATLTRENDLWSFSPKVNRVIKIPPSMKSQSWMGTDFSYDDLSKNDDIIDRYTHRLIGKEEHEGKVVYVIEAVPDEDAPVVWGKEILKIREDWIILLHEFYDQEMRLVKRMIAKEIAPLGGKLYATVARMEKIQEDEWTDVIHREAEFGLEIQDSLFTLSNLRNPRQ